MAEHKSQLKIKDYGFSVSSIKGSERRKQHFSTVVRHTERIEELVELG